MEAAIDVRGLFHQYGEHRALAGVDFSVEKGEIFGLLGPNGGGKTTLFHLLSTLLPIQEGQASVLGCDTKKRPHEVRSQIGVTFQSPSVDLKLTVLENLRHQGHLYGICGGSLRGRIDRLLNRLGLRERIHNRVESLSGGLRRRVEIAKGLLHEPQLLLLDEPSTGLDPGARLDLWRFLHQLQADTGVTVLLTTHLMEEAERCDRLGILDRGRLVALGTADELRASVGGDCLTIQCQNSSELATRMTAKFGIEPKQFGQTLRIQRDRGHELLRELMETFSEEITSISLGKPTLEDVFIDRTGHRFGEEASKVQKLNVESSRVQKSNVESQELGRVGSETGRASSRDRLIFWLPVWTLTVRELVRFFRQRTRLVGALGQPIIFWVLFGAGLRGSFQPPEWAPADMTYQEYFFPGIAVLIVMFTAIFSTISIIEDRREGFLQAVLVSPASRLSVVLGKLCGGTALAVLQTGLFLVIGPALTFVGLAPTIEWNVSVAGLLETIGFLALLAFTLTALGYVIAWPMDSTQGFHAIMSVFLMPMWLLSGAFFPGDEGWLAWIVRLNPLTYGVAGLRQLMDERLSNAPAESLPVLTTCIWVTCLFGAVCVCTSVLLTRRQISRDTR